MPYLSQNHPIADGKKLWGPQATKMLTEHWTANNIFCPSCWSALLQHATNKPCNDLFCRNCNENFELKASRWKLSTTIQAWAYDASIQALNEGPINLFVLKYSDDFTITNFLVVPKYFFTQDIIEKRNEAKVKQKNWNIRLWTWGVIRFDRIPESWKIHYISNGTYKTRTEILNAWKWIKFLEEENDKWKGWIFEIMRCIELMWKVEFTPIELYNKFSDMLIKQYPQNNNIAAKIRQQLQDLERVGYIERISKWIYRRRY